MGLYVALFRGINVGGKNIVKMEQLRNMMNDLGYKFVKSYIQSGNVIFFSDDEEITLLIDIEEKFSQTFGFFSKVILRSNDEIKNIISNCPFSEEEVHKASSESKFESLYVYLFKNTLNEEEVRKVVNGYVGKDKYKIKGRNIYLLCYDSIRNSKLSNSLGKLKMDVTVRNFKSMSKILEILESVHNQI